jgi:hypothetical protein
MGLLGTLAATSGYNSYRETINGVYYKIEGVFIDTEQEKVRVPVRGWLSEYARQNQGIGIFKRVFYIPIDEFKEVLCIKDDLVKKSYEYIKTLPEFVDCIDSLDEYIGEIDITEETVAEQEGTLEELINSLKD